MASVACEKARAISAEQRSILEALRAAPGPLLAYEIPPPGPLDPSIYRTLEQMRDAGLVREVYSPDCRAPRYALEDHVHYVVEAPAPAGIRNGWLPKIATAFYGLVMASMVATLAWMAINN